MALKIIHTADWQIGRGYSAFDPEDSIMLSEARFNVISTIADYATNSKADVILVAGDAFDAHTLGDKSLRRMFNNLNGFSGLWIFIPGNHDANITEGVWDRAHRLKIIPDNARILKEAEPFLIDELNLAILPAPLHQRSTAYDLTQWFNGAVTPSEYYRVGLAHGSVIGLLPEHIDINNPINHEIVNSAELDYLALGDWHGLMQVNPRCWYSGTPETDRFRNNESGYVLEVDLLQQGSDPVVQPVKVGEHNWLSLDISIESDADISTLLNELQKMTSNVVLDLKLTGRVSLTQQRDIDQELARVSASVRAIRVENKLRLTASDADLSYSNFDGYLSSVLADLKSLQSNPDKAEVADRAISILADLLLEVRGED